jgi:retinol dehydrogenase-12
MGGNLGAFLSSLSPNSDGRYCRLQVNSLSTPLLALLLLPIMIRTAKEHSTLPRLVVVASGVHYWITIDKKLGENPELLKTLGSAEHCTTRYLCSSFLRKRCMFLCIPRVMFERYLLTKRASP